MNAPGLLGLEQRKRCKALIKLLSEADKGDAESRQPAMQFKHVKAPHSALTFADVRLSQAGALSQLILRDA